MLLLFNFRKEQKNYFEMNSHLTTNININMNIINEHIESIEGRADNATAKDVNAILKTWTEVEPGAVSTLLFDIASFNYW